MPTHETARGAPSAAMTTSENWTTVDQQTESSRFEDAGIPPVEATISGPDPRALWINNPFQVQRRSFELSYHTPNTTWFRESHDTVGLGSPVAIRALSDDRQSTDDQIEVRGEIRWLQNPNGMLCEFISIEFYRVL